MAFCITRDYGILFALHLKKENITAEQRLRAENSQKMWLYKRKVRGFYALAEANSLSEGVKQVVPVMGLGKLKPNIVMLGYKSNWQECSECDLKDYFNTIMTVLDQRLTLIIFRLQEGFDFSEYLKLNEEQNNNEDNNRNYLKSMNSFKDVTTLSMIEENSENTLKSYNDILKNAMFTPKDSINLNVGLYRSGLSQSNAQSTASLHSKSLHQSNISSYIQQNVTNEIIPKVIFKSMNQFQVVQKTGPIDIWWLYDTGGICILVAFILRNHHHWKNSKIRVFTVSLIFLLLFFKKIIFTHFCFLKKVIQNAVDIESMKKNLIELLQKFRIPFSDVQVLTDAVPPTDETKLQFRDVIAEWLIDDEKIYDSKDEIRMRITKSELINHRELTNRHIRLRELLLEYSYDSTLIIMSMPRPGLDTSIPLYLAWLELLTQGMPPYLLIRGSQSVLTFYC